MPNKPHANIRRQINLDPPLKGTRQMTNLTESTEKAYCAECGKHWNAAVVEDGICFMCQDDLDEA